MDLLPLIPSIVRLATDERNRHYGEQVRTLKEHLKDGLVRKNSVEAYGFVLALLGIVPDDAEVKEAKTFMESESPVKAWMKRRIAGALCVSLLIGSLCGASVGYLTHLLAVEMWSWGWSGTLLAAVLFGVGLGVVKCRVSESRIAFGADVSGLRCLVQSPNNALGRWP